MITLLPYPGLRPFEQHESDIFFGREEQTDELLRRLGATRFLAAIGPSGCGKSSLVRAGMMAALETGFMAGAGPQWRMAVLRPGSRPIDNLAAALLKDSALGPERSGTPDASAFLAATLRRGPLGLVDALRETPLPNQTNLLVLVDQFEEIFRFRQDDQTFAADAFVSLLLESSAQREAPIYIVITMRSDYIGDCAVFTGLPEALNKSQYLTPRLTREQMRKAIEGPARVFDGDVDPALVNRLVNEAGRDPDQLPVLQHLLLRMWTYQQKPADSCAVERPAETPPQDEKWELAGRLLTLKDYGAVGGFERALSNHADEAYEKVLKAKFGDKGQRIAEVLFRRLCVGGAGRRDARRPTPVSRLAKLAKAMAGAADDREVIEVATVFREPQYGFLVPACPEPLDPDKYLDITHESLIRCWNRLKEWAEKEAESADTYRSLQQKARDYDNKKVGLLRRPELDVALSWKAREQPTEEWAARYGGNFKLAINFLDKSRAARTRKQLGTVFMILFVSAIVLGSVLFMDYRELHKNTDWAFETLRKLTLQDQQKLVVSTFDNAAGYLLWRRSGQKRLDFLKELLQKNKDLLPDNYGIVTSGVEFITFPEPNSDWPLSLHYSSDRDLRPHYFAQTWQSLAKNLAENWGIPVPLKLRMVEDRTLPRNLVRLTGPGFDPFERELPTYEDAAFITSKDLPPPAREFLDAFSREWKPIEHVEYGGPWWVVPLWSLPVWKVAGHLATDGSGLPAFLLTLELQKNPEPLLNSVAVEILLNRVADKYPLTVREAISARGDRLRFDLAELVKLKRSLVGLPAILDALGAYPYGTSKEVAALIDSDTSSLETSLVTHLNGPWRTTSDGSKPSSSKEIPEAYREVMRWVTPVESPIRVNLGREIEAKWVSRDKLLPYLQERLESFRDEFFQRFGIEIPGVRFRSDWSIPARAFSIKMLNQTDSDPDTQAILTDPLTAIDRFIATLTVRSVSLRIQWLGTEAVDRALAKTDPALRAWFEQRYSLTDLKLLLRAVVNPTWKETEEQPNTKDSEPVDIPPEHTLRHLDWLLQSLVFWSLVNDTYDIQNMTDYLWDTQRARLEPFKVRLQNQMVAINIDHGIQALDERHFAEAERYFNEALQRDRHHAIQCFLVAYSESLRSALNSRFAEISKNPLTASLNRPQRVDLEEFIVNLGSEVKTEKARKLKLSLLSTCPDNLRQKRMALALDLMNGYGSADQWPADEAAWLALNAVKDFNPIKDPPDLKEGAEVFLKSAFCRLDSEERYKTFTKVLDIAQKPGPNNWYRKILNDLADLCSDMNVHLTLALRLADSEKQEDLERAQELVNRANESITKSRLSPEDQAWKKDFALYSQAAVLKGFASMGFTDRWQEAEKLLLDLLDSKAVGERARETMAQLRLEQERYKEANDIISAALKKWPGNANFHIRKLWAELFTGHFDGAAEASASALRQADVQHADSTGLLCAAAIGQLLTGTGQWEETGRRFLETEHEYVPYVAMLLFARMAGNKKEDALKVIERLWSNSDPRSWKERLRAGDDTAWREMLIGYYLNKVNREDIFGSLEDDTKFISSELQYLSLPRRGMLCEAYFYDALLAEAKGKIVLRNDNLRQVLSTNHRGYLEYNMAKFLLQQEGTAR
jgi:hypothetical protein